MLASTAASALLAGATRTTWIHASSPDLTGTVQQVEVMGSEAAPAVLALSLAAIAASLATSLSSAWLRFLTGPVLVVTGVAISLREPRALGLLFLVAVLQLLTAPVAAHMVGRAGYRTGKVRSDLLVVDELTSDQERAQVRDQGRPDDDGPRD